MILGRGKVVIAPRLLLERKLPLERQQKIGSVSGLSLNLKHPAPDVWLKLAGICWGAMASQSDVNNWCSNLLGEAAQPVAASGFLGNISSLSVDDIDELDELWNPQAPPSSAAAVPPPTPPVQWPSVLGPADGEPAPRGPPDPLPRPAPLPAPGPGEDDWVIRDSVYRHWVPKIKEALAPLVALRGPFTRDVICAAMFDGMRSERQVLKLFSVPTKWAFGMERKEAAVSMGHALHPPKDDTEHHFLEAKSFVDGTCGECLYHEFQECDIASLDPFFIDVLFCTFSCWPYTKAKKDRMKPGSVQNHPDAFHLDVMYNILRTVKAKAVIFENVYGFCLSTSIEDSESPLKKMLKRVREEFPAWSISIFVTEGSTYLILIRHRLFLVFIHECAGGEEVVAMLRNVVEACFLRTKDEK